MPFREILEGDPSAASAVQASAAVPAYFAAYEKRFELPVHRPVTVRVVCERNCRSA
jgi:predicted acylesterase/phospholipase RssA